MHQEKRIFRNYLNDDNDVMKFYKLNHSKQTLDFSKQQVEKYCNNFDRIKLSIWDAIKKLDDVIDVSDPDLNSQQTLHAFQTAESLKKIYPNDDWLHLVGLIHDLGKILLIPELGSNEQWSVVGDTYPLGCAFSNKIVYYDFFNSNPDKKNPQYDTKLGIYQENCGLDKLTMSFGHDEYLYRVLKHNGCELPQIGLDVIRYHSFYSWHTHGAYEYFESEYDKKIKKWCKSFVTSDLYTKNDNNIIDITDVEDYYKKLIDKYFPNKILSW